MAETIPITRLTVKDTETGEETPVDVKTCARAVVCDENKTVQDHVAALAAHLADKTNPHGVTAAQVGADPSGSAAAVQENLTDHENDKENPHSVTKAQVGLGNVDNTADLDKPVSTAQQAAIDAASSNFLANLNAHIANKNNPHKVTAAQIGAITEGQVGNLHVWRWTQVLSEAVPAVPAGYTLGAVEENVIIATSSSKDRYITYFSGSAVDVDASTGDVSIHGISSGDTSTLSFKSGQVRTFSENPFFVVLSASSQANLNIGEGEVYYTTTGCKTAYDSSSETYWIVFGNLQRVTGYAYTPEIPAGTHVDYLTSTDPEAYQESSNGADAYYTLGDVVTSTTAIGLVNKSMAVSSPYLNRASEIEVSEDGVVTLKDAETLYPTRCSTAQEIKDLIAGKYVCRPAATQILFDQLPMLGLSEIVYIPPDVSITATTTTALNNGMQYSYTDVAILDKYQPVTGHAAVPANTTIEYLGQLGGGAKIEVGSYVGTGISGTYQYNSLDFVHTPKLVIITSDRAYSVLFIPYGVTYAANAGRYSAGSCAVTWTGNHVDWSSTENSYYQMNVNGEKYQYFAFC